MTRRSLLCTLATTSALAFDGKKSDAFALVGDRFHNSDYIRTALHRDIVQGLGLSLDMSDDTNLLNAVNLKGYRLLIVHRDGMIWPYGYPLPKPASAAAAEIVSDPPLAPTAGEPKFWIKPQQGKAVRRFVENGGAALFLHNVTHVGLTDPDFRHVLGAAYQGHPAIRPFKVKITNHDHPITRGVKDFIVTDEQHYMQYDKDPKHLLLESVNEDGLEYGKLGAKAAAGWAYDYGKGRVCYFSPGHSITAHWNPEFIKLKHNALRWLLRMS